MVSGDWLEFGSSTATPFTLASSRGVRFGKRKPVEIRVPDITGDDSSDVVLSALLNDVDGTNWDSPTNFVKTGAGTLEFANANSTFRRDAVVEGGTLKLTAGSARIGNAASALGSTQIPHTIYVESGATLHFAAGNLLGQIFNNPTGVCIHVRGGTLKQDGAISNPLGPLVLEDAALEHGNGAWYQSGKPRWPAFAFSDVTFKGSTAYDLAADGSYLVFGMNGMGNLRVDQIVSDGTHSAATPDVTISATVDDCVPEWNGHGLRRRRALLFRQRPVRTGMRRLRRDIRGFQRNGPLQVRHDQRLAGREVLRREPGLRKRLWQFEHGRIGRLGPLGVPLPRGVRRNEGAFPAGQGHEQPDFSRLFQRFQRSGRRRPHLLPRPDGAARGGHDARRLRRRRHRNGRPVPAVLGQRQQQGHPNHRYRCGLKKTGPGTLRLGGRFTCPEATKVEGGALVFDGVLAEQQSGWGLSAFEIGDGAFLGGTGTVWNVTVEEGGGFTSAVGQTGALSIAGALTLPASGNVAINVVCTNDLSTLSEPVSVPVVQSAGFENANFTLVYNGGETLPRGYTLSKRISGGIVYGQLSKQIGTVMTIR